MPNILNFLSQRALQLMQQIEIENDQEKLAQLFGELNLVLNQSEREIRPGKKHPSIVGSGRERQQGIEGDGPLTNARQMAASSRSAR
jgi:hypothetical protein